MQCPRCQFENREGVKFCEECGAKFELVCPVCKASIPYGRKFCGECGHNLTTPQEPAEKELSFEEKINKIQRYLPKGLTEKILSQRDRIEGERKQVTVMFCDMEGFTSLSEKLGPEEAYDIVDQIYELLIHKVHDYEGTVNEMTGDGIVALFGAPIALEDAPQRALRSAMAIHREMSKFSDRLKQEREYLPALKMRVGIHTGPVVVGSVGNDLRVEFKAVGDTVNLASRIERLAEPGTTFITEDSFKLTEGFFRFEALGEKIIKGKEEPVKVYRVIAPSTRRTRFDVSAERGLTPFVGRGREIEILLDAFKRAKAGRGQAISVMAEAGVGKSRLLYEFRKAVSNEDATFLEGKCLSYSIGVAYHPVIDILKSNFNLQEGEDDSDIKEKVKKGLEVLGADETATLPYLLELLSVRDSGIDKIMMSPEARKDRIIGALKRIVLKGSEIRPLILAYEDLHWIDKSSEEVLKDLLDSISGARVFLVFTYRPEFVHTWGGRSYHSQLNLNRLSNRESLAMVTHLLGTGDISRDLEELILEKTEGIPFFIEEFIKSLRDLKIIEKRENRYHLAKNILDVTIPSTIQGVIMARVDSLPEGAKDVLQTGSAIEREFSHELIKQVTGLPEQKLLSHLSVLKDSELLYERGIYPESTYIFKHALTREVVYDSILTRKKKNLHEEIGNSIEELYRENIIEYYGVLAEHYIISENYEKGAEYSRLAAKKAQKGASFNDAIAYCEKRIASLEKLPVTENLQKKIIDARVTLGLYYTQTNTFALSKEAVEPIVELALERNYKRRISHIYLILGTYSWAVEEDFSDALNYLEEAIKIAKESNDLISLIMANHYMGHALADDCKFERALYHLEKALEINVAANNLWGIAVHKSCIARTVYCFQGKIDLGYQASLEGLSLAEESGDMLSKAEAYLSLGFSCFGKGFLDEAERHLLKAVDFCERLNLGGMRAHALFCLAETYFYRKEYQESKHYYDKCIRLCESNRLVPSWKNLAKLCLKRAMIMNDEKDIDFKPLYGFRADNRVKLLDGRMKRYIGEILLEIDDPSVSNANNWIEKAIDADKCNGVMFELGMDYALYAKLFDRERDQTKAKENLGKAIAVFKECGADGWVGKYENELSTLS